MLFLNVALTSWISTMMAAVGSSNSSRCDDGSSKRIIHFSWPKKFCDLNSGVLLWQWTCRSTSWVYCRRDAQKLYGKKGRLTQTKDASQLSSAICLTKSQPIIRSPPSRWWTLLYCTTGWSNLTTDWTMLFLTSKRVAKQARTLFCIAGGKVSHCLGAASMYSGSVYTLHEQPVTSD